MQVMRIFYCVNIYARTEPSKKLDSVPDTMDVDEVKDSGDVFSDSLDPLSRLDSSKHNKVRASAVRDDDRFMLWSSLTFIGRL